MSYQLTHVLIKVKKEEAKFIFDALYSPFTFIDNKGLKKAFNDWADDDFMSTPLAEKVEKEIRYAASNDLAYLRRKLWGYKPAGVTFEEIISDVAKKLVLTINNEASIENQLIELTNKTAAQRFSLIPEEERKKAPPLSEDEIENILLSLSKKNINLLLPTIGNFANNVNKIMYPEYCMMTNPGRGMMIKPGTATAFRKVVPILIYLGAVCYKVKVKKEAGSPKDSPK
jgi:hypothetical protein